jgi:hypothetical protein
MRLEPEITALVEEHTSITRTCLAPNQVRL